jgi:hypothetical protein
MKKASRIIGETLWRPFDVRFEEIIYRFRLHRDIVWMELKLLEAEACAIDRVASSKFREEAKQYENEAELWRQELADILEQVNMLTKQDARSKDSL